MSTSLWYENPRQFIRSELRNFFGETPNWAFTGWDWDRRRGRQLSGVFPPVNVYDDGEGFRIRAEMPGIDRDSFDVSCKADQVVIRGERHLEEVEKSANFHRREREGGTFRRAVTLPEPVDPDKVQARYKDGILNLYAPRAEQARPRKILVE